MAASNSDVEDFLAGPLVIWLASCLEQPEILSDYGALCDGTIIYEVLTQIDPEPIHPITTIDINSPTSFQTLTRIKNFDSLIKNIKTLYEEELGQTIIQLPNPIHIGSDPRSNVGLQHLQLTLLLLLGCAVQCPNKELFITGIKELPVQVQHEIVTCIKQVTDDQTIVLTSDAIAQNPDALLCHLRSLAKQRDICLQQWTSSQITAMSSQQQQPGTIADNIITNKTVGTTSTSGGVESNHLAVELADWKAKLRKLRQELEEKSEALVESKEELEYTNSIITKLRVENTDLLAEARRASTYRDELDALHEQADRVTRLETEAGKLRQRASDAEFYKQRVQELREDAKVLLDTREVLEAQLTRATQRCERLEGLETELMAREQIIGELRIERDSAREKIQELIDENTRLQLVTKLTSPTASKEIDDLEIEPINSEDNSLSEQLTNNAQARALKLELENRKLQSTIDNMKETSFQESSEKILELEKEKKKLTIKVDQLSESCTRFSKQNVELENVFKSTLDETQKLQDALDTSRATIDRQSNDLQTERLKTQDLERNIEVLNKEKQNIQALCDTIKIRADDLEKSLNSSLKELEILTVVANKSSENEKLCEERRERITLLEKENTNLQKEVAKLKEMIESSNVSLDQQMSMNDQQSKEITKLNKELEASSLQLQKLYDLEKKSQELVSQNTTQIETISTLQNDLITAKLNTEKFKSVFEKLGLCYDDITDELSVDVVLQKMCSNNDIIKGVKDILKDKGFISEEDVISQTEQVVSSVSAEWKQQCEQLCSEIDSLQEQNAKLQVEISTLSSQVNSLTAQHTALQLASSQLVVEKEELTKQQEQLKSEHETLLMDQVTLRVLHEQLNSEYEGLIAERETLKTNLRDSKSELRDARELCSQKDKKLSTLEQERDTLRTESKSLSNLRTEHSRLKDDFRNLFAASERLKSDYRALQESSKTARAEAGRLRLETTSLRGELASAHLEDTKLRQKCEMLLTMTSQLESDRRAVMGHAAQLLSQYHTLLAHALAGERSHHVEQRALSEKMHALCRQKDRLEDKIMEHYRRLDSCSNAKKKSFGASLVRRVRKAGSDLINKVPGNRRSWQDDSRLTQSDVTLSRTGSGDSCNNDSDNSIDEQPHESISQRLENRDNFNESILRESVVRRSRKEPQTSNRRASLNSTTGSVLSLGSVGSRRTVYLTEQEADPNPAVPTDNNPSAQGPMLVYNKITTVIGGDAKTSVDVDKKPDNDVTPPEVKETCEKDANSTQQTKDNAIWYEYGCV